MSTGKKILIGLFVGCFIPPISIVCANFLIMFLFWYFASWGFRAWLRAKKLERRLRAENKRNRVHQEERTVDGGVIYPENFYRDDLKIARYP